MPSAHFPSVAHPRMTAPPVIKGAFFFFSPSTQPPSCSPSSFNHYCCWRGSLAADLNRLPGCFSFFFFFFLFPFYDCATEEQPPALTSPRILTLPHSRLPQPTLNQNLKGPQTAAEKRCHGHPKPRKRRRWRRSLISRI